MKFNTLIDKNVVVDKKNVQRFASNMSIFGKERRKLSIVQERCERLVVLQFPAREVSYDKLRMDLMTKLGLADRLTVLKYLGRPKIVRSNRISQEVRYLKSGTIVPKEHRFTQLLERKKGYIEIFGYAEMFLKNGKPYFRLFYENLVNKPLILFQECEGVESGEKNIYHIYGVGEVQKEHNPSGNLDDSRIVERENEEECLNVRYINLVYKCKGSKKKSDFGSKFLMEPSSGSNLCIQNRIQKEFVDDFLAKLKSSALLKEEPDRAKISWKGDSDG